MIVTKNWLNEWINIENISLDEIAKTFNRIGLEVDRAFEFKAPDGVVVGKIKSVEKHPDADKLKVCQIDIGKEELLQIVTNDGKVTDGDFVPVATVGTQLPTFKIKKGKLRGIMSFGMLCSTEEFGIPRVDDGVVILDNSIGDLIVGKALSKFNIFNDALIELELTANRGDCLSVYGVARDLASALNIEFRKSIPTLSETKGEISDFDYSLEYLNFDEIKNTPLNIRTRLAIIEKLNSCSLKNTIKYATHSTGIIFKLVNNSTGAKLELSDEVLKSGDSQIGINVNLDGKTNLIEASYIDPDFISKTVYKNKLKTDDLYYNSSRGSESNLELGISFLKDLNLLENISTKVEYKNIAEKRVVNTSFSTINNFIGANIENKRVIDILEKLGFELAISEDLLSIKVPKYRHDILNGQDITEEILRMVGIDNIPSKPLIFAEKSKDNSVTDKIRLKSQIRGKAISLGFFESVLYLFGEEKKFAKYGFKTTSEEKKLLNPIVDTMDTLRPTMTIGLLEAVERNINFGKTKIPLFEIGRIFDENRNEREIITFIFSGKVEADSVKNSGKPQDIDFAKFSEMVLSSIGGGELKQIETSEILEHPYQTASILKFGKNIGKIYKLRLDIQADFNIPTTYIAEIEFDKLYSKLNKATPFSKYQTSSRDLSIVISNDLEYSKIENEIISLKNELVQDFYPVDIFQLEDGNKSLTIRFSLQSMEKTLEDSDINLFIDSVLNNLKDNLGIELR